MNSRDRRKLDVEDRMIIQACLHDRQSMTQIASRLQVHKSTISRELKRNADGEGERDCIQAKTMIVCNVCMKRSYCPRKKVYYNFIKADGLSDVRKRETRSHTTLSRVDMNYLDKVISQGVTLGQSLHHIYVGDDKLQTICSERTIRRLVTDGKLSTQAHQLRRYATYKRCYKRKLNDLNIRDIRSLIGRTYRDFIDYCDDHKQANIVQYDSVIGKITDQQAILTITFPSFSFQFGLLIQKGNPTSTMEQLRSLFHRLDEESINIIFPINLCDNGTEFSTFSQLESYNHGQTKLRCFYTTPYCSTDKAQCERNHELVRYCLPKGKSLDFLTQEMVDDLFSNINSYVRASKNNQTPYDLVHKHFGQTFLDAIHIKKIPNKKVKLSQLV